MHPFWKKVEEINGKLIPAALVLLLGIIILELFVHVEDPNLKLGMEIADGIVVTIFVIDLIFLAIAAKSAKFFFKNYWLDLIAVLPLNLIFRLLTPFFRGLALAEEAVVGQRLLHESVEAERLAKEGRLLRYLRVGVRIVRVVAKVRRGKGKTKKRK
ncbi:MAG: hypothetical protein Q7K45_07690 [Nanoarchaeota archaeon]|nr:hypothetical protein [Nanoarchaeota archaeon]